MKTLSIFIILVLAWTPRGFAQEASAKRDLLNVRSARTAGDESFNKLLLGTRGRLYGKTGVGYKDQGGTTYALTNATGLFFMQYGFQENWQLDFTPIFYQDVNFSSQDNASQGIFLSPEDMTITLRYGSERPAAIDYGFMFDFRINTAHNYVVYLEPYESQKHTAALTFASSYSFDYTNKDNYPSIFLNLSYLNHFDKVSSVDPGLAYYMPYNETMDFWIETYGSFFIQQPDSSFFSRENYLYVSPGIRYKLFGWLSFEMGLDFLVMHGTEESIINGRTFKDAYGTGGYPEGYAPWRFNASLVTFPFSDFWLTTSTQKSQELRPSFIDGIGDIAPTDSDEPVRIEGVDAIERQLKRLREEQKKALDELEKLKEESESY